MWQLNFWVPLQEPKWHTPVCPSIHLSPPPPPRCYIWIKLGPWTIALFCHASPTYYDNRIIEGLRANQFITSVGLEISEEDQNLPYLYWTPKLHKSPYKHRFIAGSSKCTTKNLSCLLTKVLSTIKDGLVRYCNTKTSYNGVNNMWILKNSTSLLSSLDQLDVRTATSVQTFDFSTLYTSIPHDLLKSRISNLVHNAFRKKDGSVRYTHSKVTREKGYFTHDINGGGDNMYTADNICKMIEFLIDNIFVQFGGRLFRQVIGIPMGTNCAPLLADLFLYSYENEFLDIMIRSGHRRLARSFNLCYRYIDNLIVFNNKKFLDYLKEIYPSQLTVEKANKSDHLADYLDLTFIIDSGGKLSTRLYDKCDDFDFHIVNFPYLSSNIPSGPSYGVYISQLIRYAWCCSHYDDFRYRHKCLVDRLLSQGNIALRLEKSSKEILWQISGSHWEIPEVSQHNGEWFISRIIFIWHETGI